MLRSELVSSVAVQTIMKVELAESNTFQSVYQRKLFRVSMDEGGASARYKVIFGDIDEDKQVYYPRGPCERPQQLLEPSRDCGARCIRLHMSA